MSSKFLQQTTLVAIAIAAVTVSPAVNNWWLSGGFGVLFLLLLALYNRGNFRKIRFRTPISFRGGWPEPQSPIVTEQPSPAFRLARAILSDPQYVARSTEVLPEPDVQWDGVGRPDAYIFIRFRYFNR